MGSFTEYEMMDFRVYNSDKKEMVYSNNCEDINKLFQLAEKYKNIMFSFSQIDSMKKQIYRGDIVEVTPLGNFNRDEEKRSVCIVNTKNGSFKIGRDLEDLSRMNNFLHNVLCSRKVKVIGNVFQDKKLLLKKGKKNRGTNKTKT